MISNRKRRLLIGASAFTVPHLIGIMFFFNTLTTRMYESQGQDMHFKAVMITAMTILPIPTIISMFGVIFYAVKKTIVPMIDFLFKTFVVQTIFILSIPVLLAILENEMNGVVLIPSGLCFFACAAFTVFLSIVRDTINSTANNEVLHI